jgi:endonuclease III
VAFIYPEVVNKSADTRCALSRADFSRQRDVYKLAKRNPECRRLWEEFARESPAAARLVVADITSDKAKDQAANRHLDKVLAKAEKPRKISKSAKRELLEIARQPALTPEQRAYAAFRDSANPSDREAAKALLGVV